MKFKSLELKKIRFKSLLLISLVFLLVFFWLLSQREIIPQKPLDWQPIVNHAKSCPDDYAKLLAPPEIEILVSFGYKDARPARFVGDRYERAAFILGLTSPCPSDFHACDFQADLDDGDLFRKTITGPDGLPRTLNVRVISASAGPDDDENRRDTFQKWLSRHAENQFQKGLTNSQVVLYNGHSRAGGGPDFSPPHLTARGGETDYAYYQRNQPGLKTLLNTLKAGETKLQLLGLYSCVSTKHFQEAIHQTKPKLAVISSRELLYYADALKNISGTISAIAGMWCENEFGSAIAAEPNGKNRLERFFSAAH